MAAGGNRRQHALERGVAALQRPVASALSGDLDEVLPQCGGGVSDLVSRVRVQAPHFRQVFIEESRVAVDLGPGTRRRGENQGRVVWRPARLPHEWIDDRGALDSEVLVHEVEERAAGYH